jgi:hypothetical protein
MKQKPKVISKEIFSVFTLTALTTVILFFSQTLLARDFGPEWNKITFANSNYVEYQRKMEVTGSHAGIGNVTDYPIQLENHNLTIVEKDDNLGLNIHIRQYGEYSLAKDLNGKPESFTIGLGAIRYFDLNGDGYIDARYDGVKELSEIFYQGQYVSVQTSKNGFRNRQKTSLDNKIEYVFSGGQWVANQ